MRVAVGKPLREEIEARLGQDLIGGVRHVLRYYALRLGSERRPIELPDFARAGAGADLIEIEVPVEAEIEKAMAAEVERVGTSIDLLVRHALFVYIADHERQPVRRPLSIAP